MKRQMGRAITIMAKQVADEIVMHADVDAFYAPSECHGLVARGEKVRCRRARRHAKAVSGLSRRQFNVAVKQVGQRVFDRVVGQLLPDWV